MSFCIRDEGITKLLDIATLTGGLERAGYTIAGAMSDDDDFTGI